MSNIQVSNPSTITTFVGYKRANKLCHGVLQHGITLCVILYKAVVISAKYNIRYIFQQLETMSIDSIREPLIRPVRIPAI